MQWTEELDAVLNQCVFECGYDFTAAAALLADRARQLRLVSGHGRLEVTNDECQVRWMEINPVIEEDEEDDDGLDDAVDGDPFFRRSLHDDEFQMYRHESEAPPTAEHDTTPRETAEQPETVEVPERDNETRLVELTLDAIPEPLTAAVDVPDGCPRLELSLTDADLDALLNSLPSATEDPADNAADSKHGRRGDGGSSEMQWVLSFLSNPDEAAHHDAEAKNMLFETGDRSEDDNFQYFLQQLNHANLIGPEKPVASTTLAAAADPSEVHDGDLESTSGEESDSDEDWMDARKQIKTAGPSRESGTKTAHAPGHKRRLDPKPNHMDEVLPPAAPLRFPPRTELSTPNDLDTDDITNEDLDDNGLDALPRFEPPSSANLPLRMPPPPVVRPAAASSSKLVALSYEIGQQLRKNGEFQFPKRLFRDLDAEVNVDANSEQVPQDDP